MSIEVRGEVRFFFLCSEIQALYMNPSVAPLLSATSACASGTYLNFLIRRLPNIPDQRALCACGQTGRSAPVGWLVRLWSSRVNLTQILMPTT